MFAAMTGIAATAAAVCAAASTPVAVAVTPVATASAALAVVCAVVAVVSKLIMPTIVLILSYICIKPSIILVTFCQASPSPSRALVTFSMPSPIPLTPSHPTLYVSKLLATVERQLSYVPIRSSISLRWLLVGGLFMSFNCACRSFILSVNSSIPIPRIFNLNSLPLRLLICAASFCISGNSMPRCRAFFFASRALITRCVFCISSPLCRFCRSP